MTVVAKIMTGNSNQALHCGNVVNMPYSSEQCLVNMAFHIILPGLSCWGSENILLEAVLGDSSGSVTTDLRYFILTQFKLMVALMERSQADMYVNYNERISYFRFFQHLD